jgi:predicted RNA polymerase sigma factor
LAGAAPRSRRRRGRGAGQFVIAASRLDGLREPERFRAWLYTAARNESLRILRSKKGTSALDQAPEVTDDSADVSEDAERAELRTLFEEAAAGLNPSEREVIELHLRQGLAAGEVATVLACRATTRTCCCPGPGASLRPALACCSSAGRRPFQPAA